MKWMVKLVAEVERGEALERQIATIEREDQVSPASIGLTIAEGKSIMEGLQRELVTAQMSIFLYRKNLQESDAEMPLFPYIVRHTGPKNPINIGFSLDDRGRTPSRQFLRYKKTSYDSGSTCPGVNFANSWRYKTY
jgi:hypothetical protein